MRIMARRDGAGVRLITRNGNDFTFRFPFVVTAVTVLPARSFLIDGEAIVTNGDGLAVFDLIRRKRHGNAAVLVAFDLIELNGEDLRRSPIENRKHKLAKLVRVETTRLALSLRAFTALGEGQKSGRARRDARGGGGLGALMRGPISEAVIIVVLGFLIGGIAGAIIHFTFDSSNAIMPHPASYSRQ
jgi:ATP-dependent DNA ligase